MSVLEVWQQCAGLVLVSTYPSPVMSSVPAIFMSIALPAFATAPAVNITNMRPEACHIERPSGIC